MAAVRIEGQTLIHTDEIFCKAFHKEVQLLDAVSSLPKSFLFGGFLTFLLLAHPAGLLQLFQLCSVST